MAIGRYYSKRQSPDITAMVAQLNQELGGQYFTVTYTPGPGMSNKSQGVYQLIPTERCLKEKRYLSLHNSIGVHYNLMYNYLNGLLLGFEVCREKYGLKIS